jgi:hypothetical protein
MNAPWMERRTPLEVFAACPCHLEPSKTSSEPASPHACACPSCSAKGSAMVSSGVADHRCDSGTKRVAPLSGRKASIIQMNPKKRPVGGVARDVHVQLLGRRVRPQRPRDQGAELERPPDDAAARFEQRREDAKVVELRATIDEVGQPGRSRADPDVVAGGRGHRDVVRTDQPFHPIGRGGAGKDDEASLLELGGGACGELGPRGQDAEPVVHRDMALSGFSLHSATPITPSSPA